MVGYAETVFMRYQLNIFRQIIYYKHKEQFKLYQSLFNEILLQQCMYL